MALQKRLYQRRQLAQSFLLRLSMSGKRKQDAIIFRHSTLQAVYLGRPAISFTSGRFLEVISLSSRIGGRLLCFQVVAPMFRMASIRS
jgi:hypothetical protein